MLVGALEVRPECAAIAPFFKVVEQVDEGPTEQRPGDTQAPAGNYISGIVHAEIDTRHAHQEGQKHRQPHEVEAEGKMRR